MGWAVNTFSDTSHVGGAILMPASSGLILFVEVFTWHSLGSIASRCSGKEPALYFFSGRNV